MTIDLSGITPASFFLLLFVLTGLDTLVGVAAAITGGTFDWSVLGQFLQTHILNRVLPIGGLYLLGSGVIPKVPPIEAATLLAVAGLAAYAVQTIASLAAKLPSSTPVTASAGGGDTPAST